MRARYDVRDDGGRWAVYDRATAQPAVVKGVPQRQLWHSQAVDLAALLNYLDSRKSEDGLRASRALRRASP